MGCGRLGRRRSRTHRRVEQTAHHNAGRSPLASCWVSCSVLDRLCQHRWPARGTLFPQSAVPDNLLNDLGLMPLDESDDLHRRPALGTAKRIRFVHLLDELDERRPAFAGISCRGRAGGNPRSGTRRQLPLGPLAAGLVRIPPVVAHQMGARIGYVLGDFGEEIERIEHLEVARGTGQQFLVARFGDRLPAAGGSVFAQRP